MSGLTNFLTPYSHLIFANRNIVIVILAAVLGFIVVQLLMARWRIERLERELTASRASQSTSPARPRHMPAQLAQEEAPSEAGSVLPPIKGGRSYARNLGSALQKAGIPAGPQIYSPPVPTGWSANTGNNQPNPMPAPMQPPTYAPQAAPWGAQQAQPPAPWGYPAGANRAPFGAQPNVPVSSPYAPPMPAGSPQNPGQPYQPSFPQAGPAQFPQPFGPPANPNDFGRPSADESRETQGLASVAPAPAPLLATPPALTPPDAPADEPESKGAGRRGKPKRRRFNLSVLDNLEKIVQSKSAEAPATPAQPATATIAPVTAPTTFPAPPPTTLPAPVVAPTLLEQASAADSTGPSVEEDTAVQADTGEAAEAQLGAQDGTPQSQPEEQPVVEERRPSRPDMRSMLFGEEPEPTAPVAQAQQAVAAEELPQASEGAEVSAQVEETSSWQSEPAPETARVEEEVALNYDYTPAVDQSEPAEALPAAESETPVEEVPESSVPEVADDVAGQQDPQSTRGQDEESITVEANDGPAAIEPEPPASKGDAGVIVIIEDDQGAAEYYATLFRGNGYQVNVANDGVSGVDLCVKVQPQVILLDVMMPRQNGILVLQTLRASDETRNTPVVVMSNFSEPTLIKRALQLGALEYVIKTQVEGAALLTAVPRWLNREKAFAA